MCELIKGSDSWPADEDSVDITNSKLQNEITTKSEDQHQSSKANNKQKSSRKIRKEKNKSHKNELEEIHKETQRIVRESFISIPYHKPKQRSLTEFLQRRQAIPVVPLRTSVDRLNQVWKHLEEREKDAENFYKSDSEHEDEIHVNENNSACTVTDTQTCNNGKKCLEVSDTSKKNLSTTLVLQTDCNGETNDSTEVCEVPTTQLNGVTLAECVSIKDANKDLENKSINNDNESINNDNEVLYRNKNGEGCDTTVEENVTKICAVNVSNETKLDEESTYCEYRHNSNKLSESDTAVKDKEVKIPRFSLAETGIVDLSAGMDSGVSELMQRFIKHTKIKTKTDEKTPVNISVISTEHDESGHVTNIKEDVISILQPKKNCDKEEDPKLQRPGAKLAKLKAELQAHMVQLRGQEWSKKQQVQKLYEDEFLEEDKSESEIDCKTNKNDDDCDDEDDDDTSDCDYDSEEVEEDAEKLSYVDKSSRDSQKGTNKKNVYLDDEAEVSEDEYDNQDDDDDDEEGMVPPYQIMSDEKDETNSLYDEENSTLLSHSPALCLTALEGKDLQRSISFEESPVKQIVFTPLKDTKASVPGIRGLIDSPLQTEGAQDLMGLCSGQFQTQPLRCSLLEANDEGRMNSQDFSLVWPEDSQPEEGSQKLATPSLQTSVQTSEWKNILTPDDENSQDFKTAKKKRRKLSFSDDEDEKHCEETSEGKKDGDSSCDVESEMKKAENEELDVNRISEDHDESVSDCESNQSEEDNREVEYDSEENEAQLDGGKFLDVEAELSESDWDSADEDESNLNDMEQEEADKENIDEDAVKEELGKIHMKRMLVEDKKEVRLLQEMLFEDGDLHSDGGGRKRIFRWSNNDFGDEGPNKLDGESDEDKDVEEEDELVWRRFRHEREMYLREHKKKIELLEAEEDEEEDSQILKLGRAALKKMNNHSINPPKSALSIDKSPSAKCSLFQVHSRGSFLSRGREVLTRLAQITTVSETNNAQLLQPKHSHNFVFSTVSPQKEAESKLSHPKITKRKFESEPVLLPVPKRPCVSNIIKPTTGRKSLLEQLAKCES